MTNRPKDVAVPFCPSAGPVTVQGVDRVEDATPRLPHTTSRPRSSPEAASAPSPTTNGRKGQVASRINVWGWRR